MMKHRIQAVLALLAVALLATACGSNPPAPDTSATRERARQAQDELSTEVERRTNR